MVSQLHIRLDHQKVITALRLVSLTCVVLHHVLVVSVGGLGQVHARDPHGGMSPASKETELSPGVHQGGELVNSQAISGWCQ